MIQALIGPVTGLLDKFIEDKDQKNKLAHELATMADKHAQELAKGQLAINAEEAKHRSIFVAGWRPFIGWTCGIALMAHLFYSRRQISLQPTWDLKYRRCLPLTWKA